MIGSFGIIMNVIHFMSIRKFEVVNLKDSNDYRQIKDVLSDIKDKTNKLNNIDVINNFKKTDVDIIKESISACFSGLNDLLIFDYEETASITDKDKYLILDNITGTRCPSLLTTSLNIISEYDEEIIKVKPVFIAALYESLISLEPINQRLLHNYEFFNSLSMPGSLAKPESYEMSIILNSVRTQSFVLQYVVNYVVGGEV